MSRAQRRDAVLREKFHFRSHLENGHGTAEMTMDELINGESPVRWEKKRLSIKFRQERRVPGPGTAGPGVPRRK